MFKFDLPFNLLAAFVVCIVVSSGGLLALVSKKKKKNEIRFFKEYNFRFEKVYLKTSVAV